MTMYVLHFALNIGVPADKVTQLNVSMFRMHPAAKEASKATIHIFSTYYCELLARKFFVNVPYVMSVALFFSRFSHFSCSP